MQEDETLSTALATIGKNETARKLMVDALRRVEEELADPDVHVRQDLTGPIVDSLHRDVGMLQITLAQGIRFSFRYGGNIHRELVMSPVANPDHVWEPQTTRLLVHLAGHSRTVVIGGAYSGDHALLVAQALGESGTVYCFEPNKDESGLLEDNARANNLNNIVVERLGLWGADDVSLRLDDVADASHASASLDDTGSADSFAAVTLANYGKRAGLANVDLIMLDIEGSELEALKGAAPYLEMPADQAPSIVFEVHRYYVDWSEGLDRTAIVRLLSDYGYTVYALRDFQGNWPMGDRPIELIPPAEAFLAERPHGFNMVAVKDQGRLAGPLFRIRRNVSPKYLRHRDPAIHRPIDD